MLSRLLSILLRMPAKKPVRSPMRNIKLTLEYDGTNYYGFQRQPQQNTIQQELEAALQKLFRKKVKLVSASSRTDAGVHAEDQVVHFKSNSSLSVHRIERGLNHFLPDDISILKAEDVSDDFHARFQPVSKIYEYHVWNYSSRPALLRGRTCHVPQILNFAAMKQAAKRLIGKHDFRAFTSEKLVAKNPGISHKKISFVRTLKKCSIQKKDKIIVFTVQADGFLYHMVRNLVGTLIAVGKGKLKAQDIKLILLSRDRKQAAATLPACGLTLKKVIYPKSE